MSTAQPVREESPATLSRAEVESLMRRDGKPVLSVYLDTDQSREINLERGFEIVLKDLLHEIRQKLDQEARQEFDPDADSVRQFVEEYRDLKRGLVIFADASEKFLWHKEFNLRIRNGARWNDSPYVRPLIEILDEYERYAVVLTDRKRARFFTIYLGEIEEHFQAEAEMEVRRVNEIGTDHIESHMTIQHKADQHAHLHLKHVAEQTAQLASVREFDRLIVGGPFETTSELIALLPKAVAAKVIKQVGLPMNGSDALVLEESLKVEAEVEREREAELVKTLITAAHKHQKAVVELTPTVRAIQEQRVWQLVYADGFAPAGSQCGTCLALYAGTKEVCDYCSQAVKEVRDFIERAAERVLDWQGRVEQVQGPAAERLQEDGNIGAFLRW
ncbi:MAG TPA: hypothetical protein VGO73_09290 [Pyrinomonadaceae bacterium]|jgi:peptide chain release factor subunit 1|nr:hypothetical protein [Pyrinomonadaceae bacterium]